LTRREKEERKMKRILEKEAKRRELKYVCQFPAICIQVLSIVSHIFWEIRERRKSEKRGKKRRNIYSLRVRFPFPVIIIVDRIEDSFEK